MRPVSIEEGFRRIKVHLASIGRPPGAFCACELRSPKPFTEDGFAQFNRGYVSTLEAWGIVRAGAQSRVAQQRLSGARSARRCPSSTRSPTPVPGERGGLRRRRQRRGAGGEGELPRPHRPPQRPCRQAGLREKAAWVLGEQDRRLGRSGSAGPTSPRRSSTRSTVFPWIGEELAARGAMGGGLTWHLARPPVVGIDFEMDCRGVVDERFSRIQPDTIRPRTRLYL
jgi:hypothetical protein